MLALFYIVMITALSIWMALHVSSDVTWFTYFIGGVMGLFVSAIGLDAWNRRQRNSEDLFLTRYEI